MCPQDLSKGLTELGKAAVRSMYRHNVLVDISHMSEQSIKDTFKVIAEMNNGADPHEYPVLATHVGMHSANPAKPQRYNLTPATAKCIEASGGLIGLIMAQHQLGSTSSAADSQEVLRRHIQALIDAKVSLKSVAIGSDLDGFIKPTLSGFELARDYVQLDKWIRTEFCDDADAILHDNAQRVLRKVFAARG